LGTYGSARSFFCENRSITVEIADKLPRRNKFFELHFGGSKCGVARTSNERIPDMSFLFPALMFVIFIACVAFIYGEGMWGAALRLINVVTAALLATNFWEPVSRLLEGSFGISFTYWWDFLALWGIFCVSLLILRFLTRQLSQVQVRFLSLVDRIGAVELAICVGMVMVAFTTFTLNTAPLAEKFMFGSFDPYDPIVGNPGRQWLRFALQASKGSLSHGENNAFPTDFIEKYAARRAALESLAKSQKTFHVSSGGAPARNAGLRVSPSPEDSPDKVAETE
jgi:colicin V production protein